MTYVIKIFSNESVNHIPDAPPVTNATIPLIACTPLIFIIIIFNFKKFLKNNSSENVHRQLLIRVHVYYNSINNK